MAELPCPSCGTPVDSEARFCPACGASMSGPGPAPRASAEAATAPTPPTSPPGSSIWRGSEIPISWPTTLSGWLMGGGSVVAAIGLIATLDRAVSALLFLALLWIAASVFLAERIPHIPYQRLATLAATLLGLGVALDRAGFTVRGWDTAFLIGMLAAAGGALLLELGRDRPMPPPARPPSE